MTWLIALRFLMSIGLGAEVVVAAATLMEFIPARLRGRTIAALALCSPFSTLLANIVGSTLIPIAGWQAMFLIAGVGALSIWVLRKGMPESPRWLESQGRYAEAEAIVRMVEAEAYRICSPVGTARPARPPSVSASILFTEPVLRLSTLAVLLNMTVQTVVWILNGWLPSFLVKQGLTVSSSLAFAALLSVGSVGGSLLAVATVDRIGRTPGIAAASVVGMVAAALFPFAVDLTQAVISGMIMSAAIYYLLSVVFYVYQGEIFPTVFRQRGVGLGIASGRAILVLSPYLIVPLYGLGGTQAVFSLVAGLLLVTLVVIVTIGIETRGRSLEAISEGVGQEIRATRFGRFGGARASVAQAAVSQPSAEDPTDGRFGSVTAIRAALRSAPARKELAVPVGMTAEVSGRPRTSGRRRAVAASPPPTKR
jgi:putative MFS transporter